MNNAKVLVVDDDPQIRRVMRTGLTVVKATLWWRTRNQAKKP